MLKKAISFVAMLAMLVTVGCSSCNNCSEFYTNNQNSMRSSDFNQESYVWENLTFPTNRTSGIQ